METEYETYMRTRGGISNAQLSEEAAKAAWLARQSVPLWGSTAAGMSRADVENVVQRAVDHAVASGSPDPVGYVASLLSAEASKHSVDYSAVRRELLLMMDNPSWDDGSLAPIFIRLAWHSSGTYDAASGTGGSNGAGMRFEAEAADPENAGLHSARAFLEPAKRKFPGISYSDLWILAAYVGIEHTGGPRIAFRPGRVDYASEVELASYCCPQGGHGRLPAAEKYVSYDGVDAEGRPNGWQGLCMHIRNEVFYRMGFNDREIVALLCGGHVYGRCHPTSSGYAGAWVEHPTRWSNEYATDMLEDEWRLVDHSDTWLDAQGAAELRPAPGNRQYVNKCPFSVSDDANQMMLLSDMVLAWDPAFRAVLEEYAVDERRLSHDFAVAFKKLTELGCERVLQPEVAG
jgi:peroxiredoxin